MASLSSEILIKVDLRPCYVNGKRALFHKWFERVDMVNPIIIHGTGDCGIVKYTFGIVEFEDGTLEEAHIKDIRFADSGDFHKMFFPEEMLNRSRSEAGGNE